MTVARGLLVLGLMAAIGLAIVAVRMESAKAASRVQQLHQKAVNLEQRQWVQEIDLARLRTPDAIRRRAGELNPNLIPPLDPSTMDKAKQKTSGGRRSTGD